MKYKSKKLVQYKLLDRQKRHFKRKRKLHRRRKVLLCGGGEVFCQKSVVNDYQTEDDCPGDSEESDSEREEAGEDKDNKVVAMWGVLCPARSTFWTVHRSC